MDNELTKEQSLIELKAKIFDILREQESYSNMIKKLDEAKMQLVSELKQLENN